MNLENKTTETSVVEEVIYYYFDEKGEKFYTGNKIFAKSRAEYFGTVKVYQEKK